MRTRHLPFLMLIVLLTVACDGRVDVQGRVSDQDGLEYENCNVLLEQGDYNFQLSFEGEDLLLGFPTSSPDRDFRVTVECNGASESFSATKRAENIWLIDLGDVVLQRRKVSTTTQKTN